MRPLKREIVTPPMDWILEMEVGRAVRRLLLGFDQRPITQTGLENLAKYKYSGVDLSPISKYVLGPYWNWLVERFPLWVAPNTITLIGLLFNISASTVVLYHVPTLRGLPPNWVYFYVAICVWIYSSLDAIDGKQARRTGMSGPLGELFDHGCDAINGIAIGVVSPVLFQLPQNAISLAVMFSAMLAFYGCTWQEYHTGTLYLGYVSAPVEGQLILMMLLIVSGIWGGSIWTKPVHLPFGVVAPGSVVFATILAFFAGYTFCSTLLAVGRLKGPKCFLELTPIMAFFGASLLIVHHVPVVLEYPNNLLYFLVCGLTFTSSVAHVIVAHITKGRLRWWIPAYIPIILATMRTISLRYGFLPQIFSGSLTKFLAFSFIFNSLVYANHVLAVIWQLCDHLNIPCFRVIDRQKNQ